MLLLKKKTFMFKPNILHEYNLGKIINVLYATG